MKELEKIIDDYCKPVNYHLDRKGCRRGLAQAIHDAGYRKLSEFRIREQIEKVIQVCISEAIAGEICDKDNRESGADTILAIIAHKGEVIW